jgi:hypothetical protein
MGTTMSTKPISWARLAWQENEVILHAMQLWLPACSSRCCVNLTYLLYNTLYVAGPAQKAGKVAALLLQRVLSSGVCHPVLLLHVPDLKATEPVSGCMSAGDGQLHALRPKTLCTQTCKYTRTILGSAPASSQPAATTCNLCRLLQQLACMHVVSDWSR